MAEQNMSEVVKEIKSASEEELKALIEKHFEAERARSMKLGAIYIAAAVNGAIEKNLKNGMNSSHRDFQRAIKRIYEIISVQLTQQNDLFVDEELEDEANDEQ